MCTNRAGVSQLWRELPYQCTENNTLNHWTCFVLLLQLSITALTAISEPSAIFPEPALCFWSFVLSQAASPVLYCSCHQRENKVRGKYRTEMRGSLEHGGVCAACREHLQPCPPLLPQFSPVTAGSRLDVQDLQKALLFLQLINGARWLFDIPWCPVEQQNREVWLPNRWLLAAPVPRCQWVYFRWLYPGVSSLKVSYASFWVFLFSSTASLCAEGSLAQGLRCYCGSTLSLPISSCFLSYRVWALNWLRSNS